jgi:hypothetical protein
MEPIVFSSSAIAAFKRCPKSYQLGYEYNLEPVVTKQYVEDGSNFHRLVAGAAKGEIQYNDESNMWAVFYEYVSHVRLPAPDKVLMVEDPLYTLLTERGFNEGHEEVYIRTTFDLVYEREDGTIVARDYKTFEKSPTLDLDLDFQGRVYIAALMRKYPGREVEFEYEYVRRVTPGTKNSKGYWTAEDCYLRFPLVISKREAEEVWKETQWVAEAMLAARESKRFWRTDLKGSSPFTCGSCFFKDLCKAELEHGELTEQDLAILAPNRREPITLPKENS